MHPGAEKGYALDFHSVIRHVAAEMEEKRASDGGFSSVKELAANYEHVIDSDLTRVRHHHKLDSDQAAIRFLIERAVDTLLEERTRPKQVETDGNGGWRSTRPLEKMRFQGKPVPVVDPHDPHERLRDAFSPLSGEFGENIRNLRKDDMTELRDSMKAFGWLTEFPAIMDERGVVLVGHRRLTVAKELGIEPVIIRVNFGRGDAGDVRRFQLAVASNLGSKPFTPLDRKRIAEYLYGEADWSMARIAEALKVGIGTVHRDTRNIPPGKKTERRGRPRKATAEERQLVIQLHDQGLGWKKIVEQTGFKQGFVQGIKRDELLRRETLAAEEAVAGGDACKCPTCGHLHQRP